MYIHIIKCHIFLAVQRGRSAQGWKRDRDSDREGGDIQNGIQCNFQITRTANNNSIHLFAQQFGSQATESRTKCAIPFVVVAIVVAVVVFDIIRN